MKVGRIQKQRWDIVECLEKLNDMQIKIIALENNGLKQWENYEDAMKDYESAKINFKRRMIGDDSEFHY